jgi:15-cis-phytoene desaturase
VHDVVVVGGGLAGLTTALDLVEDDFDVLLLEGRSVVGGRTSSWDEDGMLVESGLHRWLGFFKLLPGVLQRCGVDVNDIVCWEDEVEIRVPDGGPRGILGLSPVFHPTTTLSGLVGNNGLMSPMDKVALGVFLAHGLWDYVRRPDYLDTVTVEEYARKHRVSMRAIEQMLIPFTAGIFFLHPDRFSAFGFFGLLAPGIPRLHRMRLGAFEGGMTDVMCDPIAAAIERRGGLVRRNAEVTKLAEEGGRIVGVDVDGERIEARHVVLATSLVPAQKLIRESVGDNEWFGPMLSLPSMPSSTIQFELDEPITDVDRTTFGPGTSLGCFAEQSRTTFKHAPGRVSVILVPPEPFLDMDPEQVCEIAVRDAARVGIDLDGHITKYRVVTLPMDFYSLTPGNHWRRPQQKTPVPGLSLAGDYTHQRMLASMEGAVMSGHRSSQAVRDEFAESAAAL